MPAAPYTITRRHFLDHGKRLNIHRVQRQEPVGQHRHEFFEIVLVLSGTGTHVTGTYRHHLQGGDTLVLNPRRTHGYEDCLSLNIVNILIRDDVLTRIGRSLGDLPGYHSLFHLESSRWRQREYTSRLHLDPKELERAEEWVRRMEEEMRRGTRAAALLQEACLALIIDLLCRHYEREHAPTHRNPMPTTAHRLGHLLSWIEKNLDRPLKIIHLAEQSGMSSRTFYRAFRNALHVTPQAYLARTRMQRAIEMLGDTAHPLSITEIALACGYGDSNYFTRCFRAATGKNPSAFRRDALKPTAIAPRTNKRSRR